LSTLDVERFFLRLPATPGLEFVQVRGPSNNDRRPGPLGLSVGVEALTGGYFTVPKPGRKRKATKGHD
jgi:hypothetical protein